MNSYITFFLLLLLFFVAFPILLNHHPRCVSQLFHRKQSCPSYPKMVAYLYALSGVICNVAYYACFHKNIGIAISVLISLAMFSPKLSLFVMNYIRKTDRRTLIFAAVILLLALTPYTFPTAIVMGLLLEYACLLPKDEAVIEVLAEETMEPKTDEPAAVATSTSEEATAANTDLTPSVEAETASSESAAITTESDATPKQEEPKVENHPQQVATTSDDSQRKREESHKRSGRPNRHSNRTGQKRFVRHSTHSAQSIHSLRKTKTFRHLHS